MSDEEILSSFLDKIHMANKNGDYFKAIDLGISAYFFGLNRGDDAKNLSITILYASFSGILNEKLDGTICCDFCGRKEDDLRMYAGPNAIICQECVSIFSKLEAKALLEENRPENGKG